MIVKGMVAYAVGKEGEAAGYLARGGAMNSPKDVQLFAETVQQLRHLPGAAEYLDPLGEALALLETEATAMSSKDPTALPPVVVAAATPASVPPPLARETHPPDPNASPLRMVTAATDPRQAVDGVYTPGERRIPFACDKIVQEPASCGLVAKGPFYLTDLLPLGANCSGQFIAVVSNGNARWVADGPPRFSGANLLIREEEFLLFGRRIPPNADPTAPGDVGCSFLWSAYRPYDATEKVNTKAAAE
jgi:hypothetical protein